MIEVKNLKKSYGSNVIFDDLSFCIEPKTICTLVGPSACGKTTLLNLITGLDKQDSGSFSLGFNGYNHPRIGYMMQDALLLPWRNLAENALLGIEVTSHKNCEQEQLLNHYFDAFDLTKHKENYPNSSSGGIKQGVALIRTLLLAPALLFLDEPFSNLDFDIKLKIQKSLIDYHNAKNATIILVTHDIDDAISLSDRVLVLSGKPSKIKAEIPIELGIQKRDPVEARKSPKFREYFTQIWDELKYL